MIRKGDRRNAATQVAQEVFGLSKVVRTFGTEEREVKRYKRWLQSLRDINIRQACAYLMYLVAASSLFNMTKVSLRGSPLVPAAYRIFLAIPFDASHAVNLWAKQLSCSA